MTPLPLLTFALLTGMGTAQAQDTYDLRAIEALSDKRLAGEIYREVEVLKMTQAMQILNAGQEMSENEEKQEVNRVVTEVQEVDSDGKPTLMLKTYEKYGEQSPTGPVDNVAGLQVLIDGRSGEFSYSKLAGPALPMALAADLDQKMTTMSNDETPGSNFAQTILPEEAVAVGDSWPLDIETVMNEWTIPKESLGGGEGIGKLSSVELVEGRNILTIDVEIVVALTEMNGAPCLADCQIKTVVQVKTPTDGHHAGTTMSMDMSMKGTFSSPKPGDPTQLAMAMTMSAKKHTEVLR